MLFFLHTLLLRLMSPNLPLPALPPPLAMLILPPSLKTRNISYRNITAVSNVAAWTPITTLANVLTVSPPVPITSWLWSRLVLLPPPPLPHPSRAHKSKWLPFLMSPIPTLMIQSRQQSPLLAFWMMALVTLTPKSTYSLPNFQTNTSSGRLSSMPPLAFLTCLKLLLITAALQF